MPARGWLAYEELAKKRADLIALNIVGDRHGAAQCRLHGELDHRLSAGDGTGRPRRAGEQRAAAVGHRDRLCRRHGDPGGRAASPPDRQGPAHRAAAAGHGALAAVSATGYIGEAVINAGRPAALRQRDLRHLRPRLPHQGRPLRDDLHLLRSPCRCAGQRPAASPTPSRRSRRTRASTSRLDADRWNARAELCAVIEPWVAAPDRGRGRRGAEEGRRAVGAVPDVPRARQPTRTRCSTIRCSPCSTSPASAAIRSPPRRCSSAPCRASRRSRRRCSASIRTRSCRVSSACRRTRSPGCMTRRSWVAQR